MLPQTQPRKKRNSSKVNLLISFIFHALIVVVMVYFAARGGIAGQTNAEDLAWRWSRKSRRRSPRNRRSPKSNRQKWWSTPKVVAPKERQGRAAASDGAADGGAAGGGTAVV